MRSSIVVLKIVLILVLLADLTSGRKPGKCPSQRHQKSCAKKGIPKCTTDDDCVADEKCCMVQCVKKCVLPIPKPYIKVIPKQRTVDTNSTISIGCYVEYQEFEGWYGPNGQKITSSSSDDSAYVKKNPNKNEWILVLKKTNIGGTYVCQGTMTKDEFLLRIKYHIDYSKNKQTLVLGRNGIIGVTISGYPLPKYSWQKDGRPVDMKSGRFTLSPSGSLGIADVQLSDKGYYSLHVTQQEGNEVIHPETFINVEVFVVKPKVKSTVGNNPITLNATDGYYIIGQQVVRKCIVDPFEGWYDPRGEKILSMNRHVVVKSHDLYESILIINNVTAEDGGTYTCRGARESKSFNVNIRVTVHDKPLSRIPRPFKRIPLLLRTDIRGYPAPKFIWYKNGDVIDPESREYSVAPSGSLGIANIGSDHQSFDNTVTYSLKVEQEGRMYDPEINVEVQSDEIARDEPAFAEGTSVECYKTEMHLAIKKDLLGFIKPSELQLRDPRCQPKENKTHYLITAPLVDCGTEVRHTGKSVVYSNTVSETKPKGMITRLSKIDIPFSCFYAKEGITSTLGLLPRLVSKMLPGSNSSTNFVLSMKLFKDKSFEDEFVASDFPLTIGLNEPLYIQVKVESPDERLSVLTERCYATPSQNPFDKVTYDVIRKGCPMDPTLRFYDSQPAKKRFTFNSFQFVGHTQKFVFVHCKLVVCNGSDPMSRCARGCQSPEMDGRRLRRNSESGGYDFTQGPIIVSDVKHSKAQRYSGVETTNPLDVWLYACLFIGMAVFCLVCLTVASVLYMKKKSIKQNVSLTEETRETRL